MSYYETRRLSGFDWRDFLHTSVSFWDIPNTQKDEQWFKNRVALTLPVQKRERWHRREHARAVRPVRGTQCGWLQVAETRDTSSELSA